MTRPPAARARVRRLVPWALALGTATVGVASLAQAADAVPDFALFRERVEPVLRSVCAECHAGKGQGQFGVVVHAPGIPLTEAESRQNYATVVKLLVPGKPDQSKFLLKPLAKSEGGVPHKGGDRIFKGTPAHKAWTDFINGVKGTGAPAAVPAAAPAAAPSGSAPDLGYFVANIEPVLLGVCAQCHAAPGKGQFALVVHAPGARFPLADHRKNFETVLRLLTPGKPATSRFLQKPLAERDGGMKHEGGDRISRGDGNYVAWVAFINGAKGPPPPEDAPPEEQLPAANEQGLVLEAESGVLRGDASVIEISGADGGAGKAVAPGAGGGRVALRFRASRRAEYTIALRAGPGFRGARLRLDGGDPLDVPAAKDRFAEVTPVVPLDGGRPLDGRVGSLTLVGDALAMDGREGTARFLSPADLAHTTVTATFAFPAADEPGRDDAWLLFDCLDHANGKFFGLSDGGRRLVMGVLESGRPRIVKSVPAPEVGGSKPVALAVDLVDGVAVGRLDGKAVLFVNFDTGLGAARFGFLTHGLATVREMTASRGTEEVHRVKFSTGAVFLLTRNNHALEIELLPQGAAVDAVVVKEVAP